MADDKACTGGAVRDRLLGLWIVAEEVDAMVTGRMTPIILLTARLLSGHGFAGRKIICATGVRWQFIHVWCKSTPIQGEVTYEFR